MKQMRLFYTMIAFAILAAIASATVTVESFESGSKASYAAADVTLASGTWNLNDALIGNLANDKKNGSWSARVRALGTMRMQFDLTDGASTVSIAHARYGTDAANSWELWYSTNSGSSWVQAGTTIFPTTTLATETFTVNVMGTIRFEIRKLTTTSTSNRINFDDITINSYSYSGGLTAGGGLGGSNPFTPTFPNDPSTGGNPPVGMSFTGTGTPTSVTVDYSAAAPIPATPAFSLGNGINRYFSITQTGGTNWSTTLALRFTISDDPNNVHLNPISVGRSIDGGANWTTFASGLTAVDLGGGVFEVQIPNVTGFSEWALGNPPVLPVELTSFTGVPTANGIELRWRTESETENDYFAIDRWIEGNESEVQSFTVRSLSQNGSSSIPLDYIYRDTRNLVPGAVYNYRMSDVNQSGERRLLRVITVNNTVSEVTVPRGFGLVETYPNPFNSMATIKVQLRETGNAKVAVYNLEGKLVKELYSGSLGIQPRLITWDASQMATGMYVVKLTSNRFSTEKKLVLMR